ncbi:MAG: FHA domain-containing protein [Anaerolineae bacterium]
MIIQEQGLAARQQPLVQFPATIGREQAPDSIFVAHSTVSRRHVRIEQRGAEYWLVDLGSTNGTSLNGNRLPKGGAYRLSDGDIFRIGDQQGNSVGITFRLGSQPLPTASTIHLSQLNLAQLPMFTVGRDQSNQVRLDHPMVSRVHAELRRAVTGHVLIDRSSNGTYVNGQRVAGQQALRQGDVVHIGPFKLVYDQAGFSSYVTPAGNYRLDGRRLIRDVPDGGRRLLGINIGGQPKTKRILNEVSLSIYPKEFVALVGGSGAGKSTLMKALSGFTPAKPGQVLLNGDDLYQSFGAYRSILGYVPQDDIIHRQLTVRSALTYAAQLRLPDATPAELQKRIADVLQQVEMTEHAGKSVQKLSGGQRKRVSIAVELLAEPGLFFLDEPTSGLDPGLEKKMMYTLRNLADAGRTIVLVTHATANIDQCDHVAFMADGYMAYFGPPKEALGFFGATDFADIYTKLSHPIDPVHNPPPPQCQAQPGLAVQPGQPAAEVWTALLQRLAATCQLCGPAAEFCAAQVADS